MVIKNKLVFIALAACLALLHILWEYFNGGVVIHHPGADASNPGISNWWGLVTYPALAWAALSIMERRKTSREDDTATAGHPVLQTPYFLAGLAFGLLASVLWQFGQEDILQYVMLMPWVVALFLRIYLPETTLGFVLGMTYTFGGVLPVIFSLVIQAVGFLVYAVFNMGGKWLYKKFA